MNMPDTTTEAGQREASVMLAELCGWLTSDGSWHRYMPPSGAGASVNHAKGQEIATIFALCPTLYNPANMALAARVLRFVRDRHDDFKLSPKAESVLAWFFAYSDDGVRTALDSVLTLAIEAGMIPEESDT